MSFGSELRAAREAQGLELADVAQRTKIRADYLRALEDGQLSALPERAFSRSYVQRYARELRLDPGPLLADFDRALPPAPEIAQSLRAPRSRPAQAAGTGRGAGLAALLTALIVLGAGGYYAYRTWLTQAPTTVTTPAAPAPEPSASPAPANAGPANAGPANLAPAEPTPAAPANPSTVPLTISSVPTGARVTLDGRDLGPTPLRSYPVQAGREAELRVALDGREPLTLTVQLDRGRNLRALLSTRGQPSTLLDLNDPAASQRGQATVPATPTPTNPDSTPAASPAASPVRLTFTGESWTRVTDASGRVLYEGTPAPGTVKGFAQGVTVRAGNAGAVQVSVNGAPPQSIGQTGQVVSRRF